MYRGKTPLFLYLDARWGWVVNATPLLYYPQERDLVSVVLQAGWASRLIWMGEEYLVPTGI
jgi:hypothetical protein